MTLQPLPPQAITAARLRKMAHQLILEAEALEATVPNRNHKKHVEFKYSLKNRRKAK